MEKLGELDKFIEIREPHQWGKAKRPRLFEIEKPINPVRTMLGSLPAYLPLLRRPKLEEE